MIAKELVIIGGSAGSYEVIIKILESLPRNFKPAIVVVLHRNARYSTKIESNLAEKLNLCISTAKDKQRIQSNHIYFASPGYHLLIEPDFSFSLDISDPVEFSRPSINVTFESAADVYQDNLTLFLLSGANADGANGLHYASKTGASCYIQDLKDAIVETMPQSGIRACPEAKILDNQNIFKYFNHINRHLST